MSWCLRLFDWIRTWFPSNPNEDIAYALEVEDHHRRFRLWRYVDWASACLTLLFWEALFHQLLDREMWFELGTYAFGKYLDVQLDHVNVFRRSPLQIFIDVRKGNFAVAVFLPIACAMRLVQMLGASWVDYLMVDLIRHTPPDRMAHVQPLLLYMLDRWVRLIRVWNENVMYNMTWITPMEMSTWPIEVAQAWLRPTLQLDECIRFAQDTPSGNWILETTLAAKVTRVYQWCNLWEDDTFRARLCGPQTMWIVRRIVPCIPLQRQIYEPCPIHRACFFSMAAREQALLRMVRDKKLTPYYKCIFRQIEKKVHARDLVVHIMRFVYTSTAPARDRLFTQLCLSHRS